MKHTTISIAGLTIGIHHIYNSINRSPNRAVLSETLKIIGRLGRQAGFYRLTCNMEDEAALVSYRGMVHDRF